MRQRGDNVGDSAWMLPQAEKSSHNENNNNDDNDNNNNNNSRGDEDDVERSPLHYHDIPSPTNHHHLI